MTTALHVVADDPTYAPSPGVDLCEALSAAIVARDAATKTT